MSKYFYKKPEIRRDLAVFAYEKIGVARLGDLGQVKRLLRPALAELEQKGFLAATGDARRYQKEGRGKWTICLVEAHADPSVIEPMPLLDPPAPSRLPVVDDLMARGVVEHVASDLVARYGVERAARQVGWLDERPTVKDPPAFLVKAIENNYPPPIKATRPSKPLAAPAPAPTPSPITPEKKREIVEEREFEAYLDTLGQDRLEEIQRIAIAEADEAQKQRVRHRVLGRMAALALRNDYIRNNLYKKESVEGKAIPSA